jgi:hypothetical protein
MAGSKKIENQVHHSTALMALSPSAVRPVDELRSSRSGPNGRIEWAWFSASDSMSVLSQHGFFRVSVPLVNAVNEW